MCLIYFRLTPIIYKILLLVHPVSQHRIMSVSQSILDAAAQYVLTVADLDPGNGFSDTEAIRASLNPDPVVLVALINHWRQKQARQLKRSEARLVNGLGPNGWQMAPMEGSYNCPLQAAIKAGLQQNVDILLQAGANPSGYPNHVFSEYAARFIRFRLPEWYSYNACDRWEDLLPHLPPETPAQLSLLTIPEIDARRRTGRHAPFWTERNLPYATMRREWKMWELATHPTRSRRPHRGHGDRGQASGSSSVRRGLLAHLTDWEAGPRQRQCGIVFESFDAIARSCVIPPNTTTSTSVGRALRSQHPSRGDSLLGNDPADAQHRDGAVQPRGIRYPGGPPPD